MRRSIRPAVLAAAVAAAFGALILAAPAVGASPFEDGCVATHGRIQGDGNLRACVWNDQAAPHKEYALYETDLPLRAVPPPDVLSPVS
jgi:hypothetical protein